MSPDAKKPILLLALVALIAISSASALQTQMLYVNESSICGPSPQSARAFAIGVKNDLSLPILSVNATLMSNSTLSSSPHILQLGSIQPGQVLSSTPDWTVGCTGSAAGSHSLSIRYQYVLNGTSTIEDSSKKAQLQVEDHSPVIAGVSPSGYINTSMVTLSATTQYAAHCRYHTYDVIYDLMLFDMVGEGTTHTYQITPGPAHYTFYVRCMDQAGNKNPSSSVIDFTVDKTAPIISGIQPAGEIHDDELTMRLVTNEDAECRFDDDNVVFDDMELSFGYVSQVHQKTMTLSEGDYVFHIACKDLAGNIATGLMEFSVALPPVATISIDPLSPVMPGLIKVKVVTDKPVNAYPSLYYHFDDDATNRVIALEGEGMTWEGYVIIPQTTFRRVGSFQFSGTSQDGVTGDQITGGRIFIVDGEPPQKPDFIRGTLTSSNHVELEWGTSEQDVSSFRIYRSSEQYVSKADFLTAVDAREFTDVTTEDGKIYFYRVSAVDEAGNEGDLSDEISIATPEYVEQSTQVFVPSQNRSIGLTKSNLEQVELQISLFNNLLLDVKAAEEAVFTQRSSTIDLAAKIGAIASLNRSQKDIRSIISTLEDARFQNISDSELYALLEPIDLQRKKMEVTVPKDLSLIKRSELEESWSEQSSHVIATYASQELGMASSALAGYLSSIKEAMAGIRVKKTVSEMTITYLDGHRSTYVVVDKSIIGTDNASVDGRFIEIVGAPDEGKATLFHGEDQHTIGSDAVYFTFDTVSGSMYYYSADFDFEQAKRSRSVMLEPSGAMPGPKGEGESPTKIPITGNAISSDTLMSLSTFNKAIISFGALLILLLSIYYAYTLFHHRKKKGVKDEDISSELEQLKGISGKEGGSQAVNSSGPQVSKEDAVSKGDGTSSKGQLASKPSYKEGADIPKTDKAKSEKVESLLDKAYRSIKDQEPKGCQEIYAKIMLVYKTMSPADRSRYRDKIIQLSFALSRSHVDQLLSKGRDYLERGDIANSSVVYGQIKELYQKMPKELKGEVAHEALKFHKDLEWKRQFGE